MRDYQPNSSCVLLFITAVPNTCEEKRSVCVFITAEVCLLLQYQQCCIVCLCVCLLLQYLLQSCSRWEKSVCVYYYRT
jgi:hypothetical protein